MVIIIYTTHEEVIVEYEQTFTDNYTIPEAEICWILLGFEQLVLPAFILIFKRNRDVFCMFSKLNDNAIVTMFQQRLTSFSSETSYLTLTTKTTLYSNILLTSGRSGSSKQKISDSSGRIINDISTDFFNVNHMDP